MRLLKFRRHFHYSGIEGTPFTLVITLPDSYGLWRMQQKIDDEVHRIRANNKSPSDYFLGDKWTVHSKWIYCKYLRMKDDHRFSDPKRELLHFFDKMMQPGWKWSHQKGIQCKICVKLRNLCPSLSKKHKVLGKTCLQRMQVPS